MTDRERQLTDLLRRCLPYVEEVLHPAECHQYKNMVEAESLLNDISMILNGKEYLDFILDKVRRGDFLQEK